MARHGTAVILISVALSFSISIRARQDAGIAEHAHAALAQAAAAAASLPGEPGIVSAAGITRHDTALLTIENRGAFDNSPKRRLVIVGGLDGDEQSARAVVDAVRWLKSRASLAVRQKWVVSALPLANPDRQTTPLSFPPPDKGFYDDPDQPESRYVWRWIVFQAPDVVVVVTTDQNNSADALVGALRIGRWSGAGAVPATAAGTRQLTGTLSTLLTSGASARRSPLHERILARADRQPLTIAHTLASRYPQQVVASYIPSVAWTNMLRLSAATAEPEWRDKVREQTAPWLSGGKAFLGDRTPLTSIAGGMIFAELASADHDTEAARLAHDLAERAATVKDGTYANGSGWTDDMFMATSVLVRGLIDTAPSGPGDEADADLAARMLVAYASRLQRPDGIFSHGPDAPHAWGRGNGFAALGLMEALSALRNHSERPELVEIARRQAAGLRSNQAPDGMFREVIDEPGSYREETATAMLLTAMARGIRSGYLDRTYLPVVRRAWRALAAHIADDGSLVDVCSSTGAGPTKRYYLDRPAITGFDDRGGAMALLASMEVYELEKSRISGAPRPVRQFR